MTDMDRAGAVERAARAVADDGLPEEGVPLNDAALSEFVLIRVELIDALRAALAHPPAPAGEGKAEKPACLQPAPEGFKPITDAEIDSALEEARCDRLGRGYRPSVFPATPAERAAAGLEEAGKCPVCHGTNRVLGTRTVTNPVTEQSSKVCTGWQKCRHPSHTKDFTKEYAAQLRLATAPSNTTPTPDAGGVGEAKAAFYEAAARCFALEWDCPVSEDEGPPREWHSEHDIAQREAGQALRRLREAEARATAAKGGG